MLLQPDRRRFFATGVAICLGAAGGVSASASSSKPPIFPKPFAGSRTIADFALHLGCHEDEMPISLRRAIDAQLGRFDVVPSSFAEERRCAAYLAWLAARTISPRALRRAGYESLALECEDIRDLRPGGRSCAWAQLAIGHEYNGTPPMPELAGSAYGTSAHASTCSHLAEDEDIEVVIQTGRHCAWALLKPFSHGDASGAEAATIWEFAVRAINVAASLDPNTDVRDAAFSTVFLA